jgi:hypothetical protein
MTMHDDFTDRQQLADYLAGQLTRGRLTLVLGAGISKPFGLPDWEELLNGLFFTHGATPPTDTPERQAEYFRLNFYKTDPKGFIEAIRRVLYARVKTDFATLRANGTLAAIGSLLMASQRGSVSELITFNFDNLLETFLGYHGFVTSSIFHRFHWAEAADVTVYHPHGLIPFDPKQLGSNQDELVFDQSSYSAVVGKDNNPWRQTMLTVLRRRTCLFIGLSGADNNLDSMLKECREQHASRDENTAYWGVTFSIDNHPVDSSIWEDRGVFYNRIADYDHDLPDFLFAICQKAASRRWCP